MRGASTLVLLAITVGVGAYVSLYELRQPTPEERRQHAHEIVDVSPSRVSAIQIAAPQLTATFAKVDGRWRLTEPVDARADEAAVLRLLYFFHPLNAQRTLDNPAGQPLPLADYGLQPPKATVTLTSPDSSVTVRLGHPTPVGGSYYAQRDGRTEVSLVRGFVFDALNKPVEEYRARAVLDLDTTALRRLSVVSDQQRYTLERLGGEATADESATTPLDQWRIIEPFDEPADGQAVSRLLGALMGLRIEQFVADHPTDEQHQQWGVASGAQHIDLTLAGSEAPVELHIGGAVSSQAEWRYARVSTEPGVYAIAADLLAPLWKDPSTLKAAPPSPAPGGGAPALPEPPPTTPEPQ